MLKNNKEVVLDVNDDDVDLTPEQIIDSIPLDHLPETQANMVRNLVAKHIDRFAKNEFL